MAAVTLLIAVLSTLSVLEARKLPAFIKPCSRNAPNLSQCLQNATEDARPHLYHGIPEMHIPPLDPMHIPHAELDTGAAFKAIFDDIRIYGLAKYVLRNVSLDVEKNVVGVDLVFPLVKTVADYRMKGRILILQLNGVGKCEGNYTNLQTRAVISGHRVMRKGKEHIHFDKIVMDLHFGDKNSLAFENIFRGNQELTDQTNKIISENIEGIMMEVKPVFDETVAQLVLGLLRGVFDRYSLDDLFPNV